MLPGTEQKSLFHGAKGVTAPILRGNWDSTGLSKSARLWTRAAWARHSLLWPHTATSFTYLCRSVTSLRHSYITPLAMSGKVRCWHFVNAIIVVSTYSWFHEVLEIPVNSFTAGVESLSSHLTTEIYRTGANDWEYFSFTPFIFLSSSLCPSSSCPSPADPQHIPLTHCSVDPWGGLREVGHRTPELSAARGFRHGFVGRKKSRFLWFQVPLGFPLKNYPASV